MDITQLAEGPALALYAVVSKGSCPVLEYISALNDKEQKQVIALLEWLPAHGPPHNKEKFRHLGDDIYELKTNLGIRILCFFGGDFPRKSLILTHGFPKPKKNTT